MQTRLARPEIVPDRSGHIFALGAFLLAIAWLYAWVPSSTRMHWFTREPVGFYNELADALLDGRVSLKRVPDPRLVALADPYDPSLNAPYRVNDLSYYKGRYFLYMGPAPAVAVFIPARLLTGYYLSQEGATVAFCLVGLAASLALVSDLMRRPGNATPLTVGFSCALALALADGYYVVVRGAIAQQVTIACAYAFSMLTLWACGRAVSGVRHAYAWFAFASACIGLAIASRPNFVFSSALLVPPLIAWWREPSGRSRSQILGAVGCAFLPLGILVAGFLAYNRARFGHAFEFGQHYQLGSWNQLKLSSSGLGHGLENAWRYLLAPAVYSPYFPFATASTWIAVGVLRHVPWLWLFPLATWALLRKSCPSPARALAASALILAAANLLTLIFLPSGNPAAVLTSANQRYMLDFLPGLVLFVGVGVVAAGQEGAFRDGLRRSILLPIVGCLSVASGITALSFDFQRFPQEAYRPLAYVMDYPTYLLGSLRGREFGALSMDLEFPSGKTGAYEPLVATGTAEASDLLYVNYVSPTQIRFGFVSTELNGPISDPISIDPANPHHLEVSMGSLYPTMGYPLLSKLTEPQAAFLKRNLRVQIDGRQALDAPVHFHPATPGQVSIGRNEFLQAYSGRLFSGQILSVHRLPIMEDLPAALPAAAYGSVRMIVHFPSKREPNAREPLLVTGVPQAADFVFVQYLPDGSIQLGLDHWGSAGTMSHKLAADFAADHTIEITLGSLLPPATDVSLKRHVRVLFDGKPVIDAKQDTYDSSPYDVTFGLNAAGGSTCGYSFTGKVLKVERESDIP